MKFIALLADGFEDIEALGTTAILRRAGILVDFVSVLEKDVAVGAFGTRVLTDLPLSSASAADYDGVFIPGGAQSKTLTGKPDGATARQGVRGDREVADRDLRRTDRARRARPARRRQVHGVSEHRPVHAFGHPGHEIGGHVGQRHHRRRRRMRHRIRARSHPRRPRQGQGARHQETDPVQGIRIKSGANP
ncbi:MAG: DJ-1/PfpI family protein [Bacillus subtilis]|nr:DJ-1/PfpI family protein [Bacillus subtilis]